MGRGLSVKAESSIEESSIEESSIKVESSINEGSSVNEESSIKAETSLEQGIKDVSLKVFQQKDDGISLIPWTILYFFIALCLFLLLFSQNLHITTKYVVQDGLAAAALAGEVADLSVLSQDKELVIIDLDYSETVFRESLQASLNLDAGGYPKENSVHFDSSTPVQVKELGVYNVSQGQIYKTDLLHAAGKLNYETGVGIIPDSRCRVISELQDENGNYMYSVTMLDGQEKEIRTTSLYAKISFGVKGFNGNTVIIEKDILTDIQENN